MATIEVLYNIAANVSALEGAAQRGAGSLQAIEQQAGRVTSALGFIGSAVAGAFSVGALINFGREIGDDADALMRMSDQTGIGLGALQLFNAIAEESGNTLDQLTQAVIQMQNRLGEGDKSAVGALGRLNLSLDELKQKSPDEQFLAIARGIAEMPDPMDRTRTAMDLFGKAGAQLLPSLRADVDAINESTTRMSDEGIKQWDSLFDTTDRYWRNFKAVVGDALVETEAETAALQHMSDVVDGIKPLDPKLLGMPTVSGNPMAMGQPFQAQMPSAEEMAAIEQQSAKLLEAAKKQAKANDEAAEAQRRWNQSITDATVKADLSVFTLNRYGQITVPQMTTAIGENRDELLAWVPTLASAEGNVEALHRAGQHAGATLVQMADNLSVMPSRVTTAGEAFRASMDGMGGSTDGLMAKIGGFFTNIPKALGNIQESLTGTLTNLFGASTNSVLGGVISTGMNFVMGPLGGIASQLMMQGMQKLGQLAWDGLKKIGGFFKDLFGGPSAQELAGRQVVDQFQSNLSAMLTEQQRLEAGNDQWKQTVIAIRDAYIANGLSEQQALSDAAALWQATKAGGEGAALVIKNIEKNMRSVGTAATETAGTVSASLGDGFQDATSEAENFARAANGRLDSMRQSGQFSADEIAEAMEKTALMIKAKFDDLARLQVHVPITFDVPDLPDLGGVPVQPMADGGIGRTIGPTLFYSRGNEDFAFSGEGQRFGSGSGSGPSMERVEGLLQRMASYFETDLPNTMARSLRVARMLS